MGTKYEMWIWNSGQQTWELLWEEDSWEKAAAVGFEHIVDCGPTTKIQLRPVDGPKGAYEARPNLATLRPTSARAGRRALREVLSDAMRR